MTDDEERVRGGIAAYEHEQCVLKRLLRKTGGFSSVQFDQWFNAPRWHKPLPDCRIEGDSFLLCGSLGDRNWWLSLLQLMVSLGDVHAARRGNHMVYWLPEDAEKVNEVT